jgi:hypothetical protein
MLAPVNAGIFACPTCESWFLNPGLSAATRARAEGILCGQHRIAALVDQVFAAADRWLDGPPPAGPDRPDPAGGTSVLPAQPSPWPGPYRSRHSDPTRSRGWFDPGTVHPGPVHPDLVHPGLVHPDLVHPGPAQPGPAQPGRIGRGRADLSRLGTKPRGPTGSMSETFSAAFADAARDAAEARQRQVLVLRYGLDGSSGRTFREIGDALHRSPERARAILDAAVRAIVAAARESPPRRPWQAWPCAVTVHLAIQALGDPQDGGTPARIRAFVDRALPLAGPDAATDLLLRLSGWRDTLARHGHDRALRRQVTAAQPGPAH